MANPATLRPKPFKKGEDPRRHKKQKGEISWDTRIKIALSNVAKALKLGEDPDEVDIKILEVFIRETLKGKFPFMKEYLERRYGKTPEKIELGESLIEIIKNAIKSNPK